LATTVGLTGCNSNPAQSMASENDFHTC
jgi:hypothetical protein